jgi:hypothetical protein
MSIPYVVLPLKEPRQEQLMDRLKLRGQNLGRVFNFECLTTKQPNLMLKTRPKQLLGFLQFAFVLPIQQQTKAF